MKIFVKIRESLARRSVKKKMKSRSRNRHVNNFTNSKKIGIYFENVSADDFKIIREFSKDLEKDGIKVTMLGFVKADEIPGEMSLRGNCHIIITKDLDWLYRPKSEPVSAFISNEFDILFDLSIDESIPGFYINSLSVAQFKAGRYRETENDIDFMIKTDQDHRVEYLIEQLKTYVSMLNKQE